MLSPATSIACGMVFFSDILDLNAPPTSNPSEISCSEYGKKVVHFFSNFDV
jgi:hypothetical protein